MEEKQTLICSKCQVEMKPAETHFSYLGHVFRHRLLRCPECGQIYVPESLAKGRMAQVEGSLEEK